MALGFQRHHHRHRRNLPPLTSESKRTHPQTPIFRNPADDDWPLWRVGMVGRARVGRFLGDLGERLGHRPERLGHLPPLRDRGRPVRRVSTARLRLKWATGFVPAEADWLHADYRFHPFPRIVKLLATSDGMHRLSAEPLCQVIASATSYVLRSPAMSPSPGSDPRTSGMWPRRSVRPEQYTCKSSGSQ